MSAKVSYKFLTFILFVFFSGSLFAQINEKKNDSTIVAKDTIKQNISPDAVKSKVSYNSEDSLIFDMGNQKAFLFGNAEIYYEDIVLKAEYVEITFKDNELFARGSLDSLGKEFGNPVFTENAQSFNAKTLNYNFKSKKGLIKEVITKEGDNYLHGQVVKKLPSDEINIKNGLFTTCDRKHPHFEFKFGKAKVIPKDKIVTGPVYLVVEDVPTPLALPFGLFPNKKGQQNGFLIPTYGNSASRGFFLENGGYYFGLSKYMDLELRGDIYTRGSWAVKVNSNYNRKYHYNGSLNLNYSVNTSGTKGLDDYNSLRAFFIRWQHKQDPKARPNSNFTANVNAGSSSFNRYNPSSVGDYLTNTFQSSVAYQTTIAKNYNLAVNLSQSQNIQTHVMELKLPEVAFTANRFYPFRKRMQIGTLKWYENIGVSYSMSASNIINTLDSLLFREQTLNKMRNGVYHPVQISSPIKVLKYFTLTNSINYRERWYYNHINRYWASDITRLGADTNFLKVDTIKGFITNRDFDFSSSLNTRFYGMYKFKKGYIKAIRHVVTPSVSFVYLPDFGSEFWGYYKNYSLPNNPKPIKYSIFENGIYGGPPPNKSGAFNFIVANNLEAKVKNKKDSITGSKKIVLVDNFNISTRYDMAKDSLNWSDINLSGRTVLFRNLNVTYGSSWSMYQEDSLNTIINKFVWEDKFQFARQKNYDWGVSLNYNLSSGTKKNKTSKRASEEELQMIKNNPQNYVDFDIPWNFSISYTLSYTKNIMNRIRMDYNNYYYPIYLVNNENDIVQNLSFSGDISLTPKWKFRINTYYDLNTMKFSTSNIGIDYDLHCWEMKFNWIPIGYMKSYSFTLGVKAAALQDMKLTKKTDWRDRF